MDIWEAGAGSDRTQELAGDNVCGGNITIAGVPSSRPPTESHQRGADDAVEGQGTNANCVSDIAGPQWNAYGMAMSMFIVLVKHACERG